MSEWLGEFVIVRSRDQGVVCGVLDTLVGRVAVLTDARQIHSWSDGANTLFEMSLRGCGTARISEPVKRVMVHEVCGVLQCEPEAEMNLRQSRWGESYKPSGSPPRRTRPVT
jgi:hypothetical protein